MANKFLPGLPMHWRYGNSLDAKALLTSIHRLLGQQSVKRLSTGITVSALLHVTVVLLIAAQASHSGLSRGFTLEARIVSPTQPSIVRPLGIAADQQALAVHQDKHRQTLSAGSTSSAILRHNEISEISNPIAMPQSAESVLPTISLPADPTYYPAAQLDIRPKSLAPITPEFPPDAAAANVDGRVILLVLIDETGMVNDASIVEASPAGYFEESALTAVRMARFEPGQRFNQAVKSRVLLSINYDQSNPSR